ncbi:adenylate/guanylate cyclase domain-containing protein [Hymenobacter cavernae]|uniref:Guanylate cyclase domain-containing protein n=1 Tax=Hymenobacter cavernae TaxID=2044852 RepID=A0ABQ1UVP8_9BACT|nr:adenylate/guanylate cyclase domain-containing protein [Hymenobacter cavernae]GGF26630.1 hypothetical protein GCM10011383_42710 [Hymenobacter cavernae]
MANNFEYTTVAQRHTARFPVLAYVGIQANFWIVANLLLVSLLALHARIISQVFNLPVAGGFGLSLFAAVIFGILWGVSLGLPGYYLDKSLFGKVALGKIILIKALLSLALIALFLWLLRLALEHSLISLPLFRTGTSPDKKVWSYIFDMLLVYYFFMTLVISFINQINKKYGPGVLLPLLLGKYRTPKEEERIFMFMDLQSSTTIAEKLGHSRYSSFIRDCFADINQVLFPYSAQVYQYVGDEIVVMWPEREGLQDHLCIRFYFACKKQFQNRAEYYTANYGIIPHFKAGVHTGHVTAVEIGEIKRDIAYHGDTLNTAARIQSVCNQYNKEFLVSEYLLEKTGTSQRMKTEFLGQILLRGKLEKVGIVSVDWPDSEAA